jgi:hypothetical protein
MLYETNIDNYKRLKTCLSEIYPEVEVKLISSDPMLKELGFVDKVPCQVEVCATKEQIDEIRNMAIDFEVMAFNTPDGDYPKDNDEDYIKYARYGWLFDFL